MKPAEREMKPAKGEMKPAEGEMKPVEGPPMDELIRELKKEEEKLFNCVHCGFCLPVCPTYTRLGDESDSPRGRLHFMRAMVDGRIHLRSTALGRHLDRCLGCRACESVCPSGVEYGRLLEGARSVTAEVGGTPLLARLLSVIMANRRLRRLLMFLARGLRATGVPDLAAQRLPPEGRLGLARLGMGMIAATERGESRGSNRRASPGPGGGAEGPQVPGSSGMGAKVGLLLGCVQEGLLARVNRATERVLGANGYRVIPVPGQECCGAIHAHTGDLGGARELARRNIQAFEKLDLDLVVVNAAGCGAAMKEYPHLLAQDPEFHTRALELAHKVRDISELLGVENVRRGAPLPLKVAYDAPCHLLHAQKIAEEPVRLLEAIPELERVPLEGAEECCGGAGIYGITHPDLGARITGDKVRAVLASGAQVVATGNPGCMMQIGAGLRMAGIHREVVHPVELLDESYRNGGVYG